jgi:hypothetical protein
MKVIRVFPRKTSASPIDENVRFELPNIFDEADSIRISVTFTDDRSRAENLYRSWRHISKDIEIGGPAYDDCGSDFIPGMYVKKGLVFTSRGCPNNCWFCYTPKREGSIRELKIYDGYNILDSNLLACSEEHIRSVFTMLSKQKEKPRFTGGLDTELVKPWIAESIVKLNPSSAYFAYDTPSAFEPLVEAWNMFKKAGVSKTTHNYQVYVLIGYGSDTLEKAKYRLDSVLELGLMPLAMLYNKGNENKEEGWSKLQREYANKIIVGSKLNNMNKNTTCL